MTSRSPAELQFREFDPADREACLALFDANCPRFFAPNEREDYAGFLSGRTGHYEVVILEGRIRGAYGVHTGTAGGTLTWVMIHPDHQGLGIGSRMMARALETARALNLVRIEIGASQHSAPFFARFGAREFRRTPDGWGPGMHRIDMNLTVGELPTSR